MDSMDRGVAFAAALTALLLFGCTGQSGNAQNGTPNPSQNVINNTPAKVGSVANSTSNATPPAEGTITERVVPQNSSWKYVLYLPPNYNRSRSYPLVIGMHGTGGLAVDYANQWKSEADKNQFIFAFPQSPDTQGWDIRIVNEFVAAVVGDVKANYNITNMYLTGHSAGAHMLVTIALLNPHFRGAAQVDGTLPPWYCPPDIAYCQNENAQKYLFCKCAKGQYFFMLNGQNDDVVTPSDATIGKNTLEECGVNVTQKFMPNHGHEYPVEENAEIMAWFKTLDSDATIKPNPCSQ